MSDEGADFADQVLALYKSTLSKADRNPCREPDVRRVAFGLVALRQALDHFLTLHRKDPVRLTAAGAYEADDILTALTSGTAHPIRKYVKSLNSSEERHNRPPPSAREQTIRAMLAGAVLAYKDAANCQTTAAAARAIASGIRTEERLFTAGQLAQWTRHNNDRAKWFEGQFRADAALVPEDRYLPGERILIVARKALHPLLAIPV